MGKQGQKPGKTAESEEYYYFLGLSGVNTGKIWGKHGQIWGKHGQDPGNPHGTHVNPGCKTQMGPIWVAQMGPILLPIWGPYGTHMCVLAGKSI